MKNLWQQNKRRSALSAVLVSACLATVFAGIVRPLAAADGASAGPLAGAKTESATDDMAIRATADEFAKAFNAGDAKALGGLWTEDAEYTDERPARLSRSPAIEEDYASLFKGHPGAAITLAIESIRFLGPDAAIEKGVATVKLPAGGGETASRYT